MERKREHAELPSFHDQGWNGKLPGGTSARVAGSAGRGDGWQDRTEFTRFRSTMTMARPVGRGRAALQLVGAQDRQEFGTPVPYEAGKLGRKSGEGWYSY